MIISHSDKIINADLLEKNKFDEVSKLFNQSDVDKFFLNSYMYFMKNRNNKKAINKNIVSVKVKDTIDLTSPLTELLKIKNKLLKEQNESSEEYKRKQSKYDDQIKETQKKVSKLKDSFDKIIQKV